MSPTQHQRLVSTSYDADGHVHVLHGSDDADAHVLHDFFSDALLLHLCSSCGGRGGELPSCGARQYYNHPQKTSCRGLDDFFALPLHGFCSTCIIYNMHQYFQNLRLTRQFHLLLLTPIEPLDPLEFLVPISSTVFRNCTFLRPFFPTWVKKV